MTMLTEAALAAAFCAAVLAAIGAVKGRLLAPGRAGAAMTTICTLRPGDDPEQLGRWLAWLRGSGGSMDVVFVDGGLGDEDRRRARRVTEQLGGELVSPEELLRTMGDRLWQEKETK